MATIFAHTPRNVSVMNELKLYPSNDIISREDTFLSHDKISAKVFALQNTFEQNEMVFHREKLFKISPIQTESRQMECQMNEINFLFSLAWVN